LIDLDHDLVAGWMMVNYLAKIVFTNSGKIKEQHSPKIQWPQQRRKQTKNDLDAEE
jgi:hypothetical protein